MYIVSLFSHSPLLTQTKCITITVVLNPSKITSSSWPDRASPTPTNAAAWGRKDPEVAKESPASADISAAAAAGDPADAAAWTFSHAPLSFSEGR
jgi:hypothetical protein